MEKREIKLTENESNILKILAEDYDSSSWGESGYFYFRALESKTGLDRRHVRLACRSLARKGYAEYEKGLINGDGEMAGAGYGCTRKGAALFSPCDVCGDLSMYSYDGKLECELHYKQSKKVLS